MTCNPDWRVALANNGMEWELVFNVQSTMVVLYQGKW